MSSGEREPRQEARRGRRLKQPEVSRLSQGPSSVRLRRLRQPVVLLQGMPGTTPGSVKCGGNTLALISLTTPSIQVIIWACRDPTSENHSLTPAHTYTIYKTLRSFQKFPPNSTLFQHLTHDILVNCIIVLSQVYNYKKFILFFALHTFHLLAFENIGPSTL